MWFGPRQLWVAGWLLLTLLLGFPADANTLQVTNLYEQTSLAGGWRYKPGDDVQWARPDWNDRNWEHIRVPNQRWGAEDRKHTIVWYRRTLLFPKRFQANTAPPLGIILGKIYSAYEVYAGGIKIGEYGRVAPSPRGATPYHQLYRIPAKAFQKNKLVLAIRIWQPRWLLRHYKGKSRMSKSYYSFGLYPTLKQHVEVIHQRRREAIILMLFIASLLVIIAIYHFHLYRGRAELSAYLWYGFLLLFLAGWVAGKPLFKLFQWYTDSWGWILTRTTAFLAFVPGIEFCYRALDRTRPPKIWQILQGVCLVGGLICLAFGPALAPILPNALLSLVFSGILLAILVLIIKRAWEGHPDARTIQFGLLAAFILLLWKYAISAKLVPYVSLPLPTMAFCIIVLSLAFALSNQYRRTLSELKASNRELQEFNHAIQRFVPFEFLSHLEREDIRQVQRGDQVLQEMTIFFSDVRSFTSLVEKMTPAETMAFVNNYLRLMEPPINQHSGFIDKYIGDAVMALFDHPDHAIQAAIGCLKALQQDNQRRTAEGLAPIHIGIGLHTGTLMLGTVGGHKRLSCTVLGDSVNLAARVESMTKLYGATLLITGDIHKRLLDPNAFQLQHVDRVAVKGKTEPVDIYEIWDGLPPALLEQKQHSTEDFQRGYKAFQQGDFAKAKQHFQTCHQKAPDDQLPLLYLERCEHFLLLPPPKDWDGVIKLQQK